MAGLILSPPPNDQDVQGIAWKQWFFKIRTQLLQALDLTNVSGVLAPDHGGTGSDIIPTNGQVPIGNGSVYVPNTITAGSNISVTNGAGTITIASTQGNSFGTVAVAGQSDVVAEIPADTLTLVAGTNITITTNAGTDSITINSSGGGGGTSFYNKLPSNTTIATDTSYILAGDLDLNGFDLTVNGNLGFI